MQRKYHNSYNFSIAQRLFFSNFCQFFVSKASKIIFGNALQFCNFGLNNIIFSMLICFDSAKESRKGKRKINKTIVLLYSQPGVITNNYNLSSLGILCLLLLILNIWTIELCVLESNLIDLWTGAGEEKNVRKNFTLSYKAITGKWSNRKRTWAVPIISGQWSSQSYHLCFVYFSSEN